MSEGILFFMGLGVLIVLWIWSCIRDREFLLKQESEWLKEEIERYAESEGENE